MATKVISGQHNIMKVKIPVFRIKLTHPIQLLLIGLVVMLIFGGRYLIKQDKIASYTHPSNQFSLDYPATWFKDEFNGGLYRGREDAYLILSNQVMKPTINLIVFMPSDELLGIEEIDLWSTELITREGGSNISELQLIDDDSTHGYEFFRTYEQTNGTRIQLFFRSNEKTAIIDVFPAELASSNTEITHILESFYFKDKAP